MINTTFQIVIKWYMDCEANKQVIVLNTKLRNTNLYTGYITRTSSITGSLITLLLHVWN
jgi:hypothetical protein